MLVEGLSSDGGGKARERMNILQVGTIDCAGGAARVSWDLKRGFEARGHHVSMFVAHKYSDDENVYIIPRHRYQERISRILGTDLDFYKTDYILETDAFKNADVIQCHNLHGYYFNIGTLQKMTTQKPVVWTLHDMWAMTPHCAYSFEEKSNNGFYDCPNLHSYPQIEWHNESYLMKRKRKVYTTSQFQLVVPSQWLQEKVEVSVLKEKQVTLIYNGIDVALYVRQNKNNVRNKLHLDPDKKIILFLAADGKYDKRKGWTYTHAVMKYFRYDLNIVFVCVGGAASEGEERSNQIIYVDYVKEKDVLVQYFSAADVLLFPSLADNFPLTVLEAMSSGLPVVAFDVGGVKEAVIHMECGYIAPYKSTEGLIEGIQYIVNLSESEREKMAQRSRARVLGHFTIDRMADAYLNVYSSLA